jgi:hypothetical protein
MLASFHFLVDELFNPTLISLYTGNGVEPSWQADATDTIRIMYLGKTLDMLTGVIMSDTFQRMEPVLSRIVDVYQPSIFSEALASFRFLFGVAEYEPDPDFDDGYDILPQIDWDRYPHRLEKLLDIVGASKKHGVLMEWTAFQAVFEGVAFASHSYRFHPYDAIVDLLLPSAEDFFTGIVTQETIDAYASMLISLDEALCPCDGEIVDFSAVQLVFNRERATFKPSGAASLLEFGLSLTDAIETLSGE